MKNPAFAFAAFLALASAPSYVGATFIDYSFSGTVDYVQNVGSAVLVGDQFSATLRYDPAAAIGTSYPPTQTDYAFTAPGGGYALNVQVGNYSGSGPAGQISILNNSSGQDWFQTLSYSNTGFTGDAINGLTWAQTTLTLKDYQGTLYSDTSLPNQIAELKNFEEAFATMFFDPTGLNGLINAQISSIQAVISNTNTAVLNSNVATEVLPDQAAGGMVVTLPANTSGQFTATYSQQAAADVDLSNFNFFIPGTTFQVWDLHFNGTIPSGSSVNLVFTYDDTGMSYFQEIILDIVHEVNGQFFALHGVVDPVNNTITASTTSFSDFILAGTQVPEPTTLALLGLGLAGLGFSRRKQA